MYNNKQDINSDMQRQLVSIKWKKNYVVILQDLFPILDD